MVSIKETQYIKGNNNIIIRSARIEDAEELLKHVHKIHEETTFLLREPEEFDLTIEEEEKFISSSLSSDNEAFIITEVNGKIAGSCTLKISALKRERHKGTLGIALQEDFWGLGIGTKLMETVINWGKTKRLIKISLKVDTSNRRAINLYNKMGFEVEGKLLKDKVLKNGSYKNSYEMALFL
ncbi:GNAT family N-acetyltransferase [Sporosalibacterium faouarense]|uniref:GNAT family N-acetyltransferase n=1 Tax=Sporosalibacterium faouarense TaxID=516123 RepID=UPI00192B9A80|nr:GNAT family N-acetyltransferase [Sporosalibacterium faouarense]